MLKRFLPTFAAIVVSFLFHSCNLINPEETIPAYVEIKAADFSTTVGQGSSSSRITDVWVYVDGSYLGAFELPCQFPVLKSGKHVFKFGAGIMVNGIASTRSNYPMYRFVTDTLDLVPEQVTEVDTLRYTYFPDLHYPWMEDFEGGSISMDTTGASLGHLEVDTNEVFEGKRSLRLQVYEVDSIIEAVTNLYYGIPLSSAIYLEMNYKCDVPFYVGLQSYLQSGVRTTVIERLNKTEVWNKIYIDLTGTIAYNQLAAGHRIYFYVQRPSDMITGKVYLDNLKIIYN